jgi:Bacterial SH3 domain
MTIINRATLEPSTTPGDFPTVTPHIFCEESPESFLIIAERGQVTQTEDGETLNLRNGPGINYRVIEQIEQLETFYVLDGPQCNGGYTWFQINYNGRIGWVAEGNEDQYFAEPYLTG